jgi:hypothetical protein
MKMQNEDGYDEGYNAYFNGMDLSENPHYIDNIKYSEWESGWYSALAYSEYEEQQYRGL